MRESSLERRRVCLQMFVEPLSLDAAVERIDARAIPIAIALAELGKRRNGGIGGLGPATQIFNDLLATRVLEAVDILMRDAEHQRRYARHLSSRAQDFDPFALRQEFIVCLRRPPGQWQQPLRQFIANSLIDALRLESRAPPQIKERNGVTPVLLMLWKRIQMIVELSQR